MSLGINLNVSMMPDVLLYHVGASCPVAGTRSSTANSYSLVVSTTFTLSVLAIYGFSPGNISASSRKAMNIPKIIKKYVIFLDSAFLLSRFLLLSIQLKM